MSSQRKVAASGLVGVVLAFILILAATQSGIPVINLPSTTGPGQANGGTTSTTGQSAETGSQGAGALSILVTDPPSVPAGVTGIYVVYDGLAVHGPGGWTTLKATGGLELMGTVNLGETLASANLTSGTYDQVRLDILSAEVLFDGVNYTAVVQGGQMTMKLHGNVDVPANGAAAAIIDMRPTVLNIGSPSSPQFVVWANARAFEVPASGFSSEMEREGNTYSLSGVRWWQDDEAQTNASLQVTGGSLSSDSLALTLKNVGTDDVQVKLVVVTQAGGTTGSEPGGEVPSNMTGSAVFVVLANGTLVQFRPLLHMVMPMIEVENGTTVTVYDALLLAGYNLTAGSSASFSYSGSVQLGFGLVAPVLSVAAGSSYWITVIGEGSVSSIQVTAQ
jgi:Domain of unknown function (DUF4382)